MLSINSITSCKINGIPLLNSNLSKKNYEYKNFINNNFQPSKDNELNIITISGLYGYRVGMFGKIANICSLYFSKNNNPVKLQKLLNYLIKNESNKIQANDFEILSYFVSMFTRCIPIINYGNWDPKQILINNTNLINATPNLSLPKIYNLNSLYFSNPLFDSGCAIYSDKTPHSNGFVKWSFWDNIKLNDNKFNKGIVWSFFKTENSGVMIITLNLHNSDSSLVYNMQMNQITKLKKELEQKFSPNLEKYETYITGDFNSKFNNTSDIEIQFRLNIFTEANLEIINKSENLLDTHFIFYSSNSNKCTSTSISRTKLLEDEFININFNTQHNDIIRFSPSREEVHNNTQIDNVPKIIINDYFRKDSGEKINDEIQDDIKVEPNEDIKVVEIKDDIKVEPNEDIKVEPKDDVKVEIKDDVKVEPNEDIKVEIKDDVKVGQKKNKKSKQQMSKEDEWFVL